MIKAALSNKARIFTRQGSNLLSIYPVCNSNCIRCQLSANLMVTNARFLDKHRIIIALHIIGCHAVPKFSGLVWVLISNANLMVEVLGLEFGYGLMITGSEGQLTAVDHSHR